MCGIVFAGSSSLGQRDVDLFKRMLYCDVVRGEHSTGVFSNFYDFLEKKSEILVRKSAVPADIFIRDKTLWGEVSQKSVVSAAGTSTIKRPNFLVGHNRFATKGSVTDKNAHPFQHKNITLVHNGTLDDQTLLPNHRDFEVDSENICFSIAENGIDETIKNLNGKFMLVWHDSDNDTLNFLRNCHRPFHFCKVYSDWFGASEEDMLMWLINRSTLTPSTHFEAEVGTLYTFDVSGGGFKLKEERKLELPKFQDKWNYSYKDYYYGNYHGEYSGSSSYYSSRVYGGTLDTPGDTGLSKSKIEHKEEETYEDYEEDNKSAVNSLLQEFGVYVTVGEKLHFSGYGFESYPNSNTNMGTLLGFLDGDRDTFIEIRGVGVNKDSVEVDGNFIGEIAHAYVKDTILTITVIHTKERVLVNSDNVYNINGANFIVTKTGETYTKSAWESNPNLNTCGICSSYIPFEKASEASSLCNGFVCADCDHLNGIN